MSEILEGHLDDAEKSQQPLGFIIAVIGVQVGAGIETVVGSVKSYRAEKAVVEVHDLEARVTIEDGYGLVQAGTSLKIAGFELHFGEEIHRVEGPMIIQGLGLQDLDPQRGMCTVSMQLRRE